MKSYTLELPVHRNFLDRLNNPDPRRTKFSFLENIGHQMRELIQEIDFNREKVDKPPNLAVRLFVDRDAPPKKFLSAEQLKFMTGSMLATIYCGHYKIFTDASKSSLATGIGITDLRHNRIGIGINNKMQITNAELIAILRAIRIAAESRNRQIVILTDSLEGCRQIDVGNDGNYIIKEIWSEIHLQCDKEFSVQWIPGHCGVIGNEEADAQANVGCLDENPRDIPITIGDAILHVRNEALEKWQNVYENTSINVGNQHWKIVNRVSLKPWFYGKPFNGMEIKIITRLRTGHGLCGVKKFLFKINDSYFCLECGEIDDLSHIMLRCKKYVSERNELNFHLNCDSLVDLMKDSEDKTLKDIVKFYFNACLDF